MYAMSDKPSCPQKSCFNNVLRRSGTSTGRFVKISSAYLPPFGSGVVQALRVRSTIWKWEMPWWKPSPHRGYEMESGRSPKYKKNSNAVITSFCDITRRMRQIIHIDR